MYTTQSFLFVSDKLYKHITQQKPIIMKRLFTVLLLLSTVLIFAQVPVQRQTVLVEVGTGTWCSACPAVVNIIDDLLEDGANIAVIEYHNGDAYTNADGAIREDYYSFPWFPTTYYDSNHIGYNDWATYSVHLAFYEERRDSLASFGVNIIGELNDLTISGTMYAERIVNYIGNNLVMHLVLTESDIPENWQGETELDFVERKMFPDGHGTALDFSSGAIQGIDFSFDMEPSWNPDNCQLVYFIQNNDTKEILQGNKILLNDLSFNVATSHIEHSETYIFPNPVQDVIKIHADNNQSLRNIEVIDLMGKIVIEQAEYQYGIEIDRLPKGIYLVSYMVYGERKTERIVKR